MMQTDVVFFKDASQMDELPNASIQLVITSPPYWNVKDYSLDGRQQAKVQASVKGQIGDLDHYEAYLAALLKVWRECERVLKPNGKLCINAPLLPVLKSVLNTHYTRDIVNIAADIEREVLKNTSLFLLDVYVWRRTNPTKKLMFGSYPYPPNFYAQNTVEFVNVYVKDGEPEKRPDEIKEQSKLTEDEWVQFTQQVWELPIPDQGDEAYGEHPAIMPLEMAKRLVRLFSFVGDVVLDPFMGSGTTAKAARDLGRRYVGYEINRQYERLIRKRLG